MSVQWLAEHVDVDVAGAGIFVRRAGQGQPLLLLHGFPQTGDMWSGARQALPARSRSDDQFTDEVDNW
ncbi:MAG: hypothetical protein V4864_09480 [Pseudomonadota bacterium]